MRMLRHPRRHQLPIVTSAIDELSGVYFIMVPTRKTASGLLVVIIL